MNLKNLFITIIGIFCAEAHGEIYKCIDTNGGTTFQQKPCDENSKISEKIHINKNNKHGPVKLNEENRKNYELALNSNSIEYTASECRRRNSSYAQEVQQASERLYEIRKSEIEAGKDVLNRGFPGLPPSEIAMLRDEGRAKLQSKLSSMSRKEIDIFCSTQARKARSLAARSVSRSSGYIEGDLDPEGND